MRFYIVFKYGLSSIFKSKVFLWLSSIFLVLVFFINLAFGLSIKITDNDMSKIFILDYLNVILILLFLVVISLLFSNELFYNQKKNGIKTIEVKNGLKIWQIFFAKLLALIVVILDLALVFSTIIVLENLIIFNDNTQVIKLIFINLYLIFLVPLFILSLNLLALCLNLQKITLIFSGFFLGLLSLFPLLNSEFYTYRIKEPDARATSNDLSISNYKVYFNYYIQKFKKNYSQNNSILNELKEYDKDSQEMKNIITYDNLDKIDDKDLRDYYQDFANKNDTYFYSSGNLFYNIDLFNSFNDYFIEDNNNVAIAKYDKNLVEKNILFKALSEFDIAKTSIDLFQEHEAYHNLRNSSALLREMKRYINQLEIYFKENASLNNYYFDLRQINNLIKEIFEKSFYFNNDLYFLANNIIGNTVVLSSYDYDISNYFKEPIKSLKSYHDLRKEVFKIQKKSSASSLYKGILFYIINNYNSEGVGNLSLEPDEFIPNSFQMSNYYTSPFLWLEFLTKYGFSGETFDNIISINSSNFIRSNNFFRVYYEDISHNSSVSNYKIIGYQYKGPNTLLLIFLIFAYSTILISLAFLFYKLNFYK